MSRAAEAGDGVAEQYSRWVYPRPIADLRAACRNGERCPEDPTLMQWAYWPAGGYPRDLRILVAGCGANQAAITAFHNPRAQVTGIDLASPSLGHESLLKQRHDREIDGRRSVEECLESAGIKCTSSEREAFASQFLGAMWRFGYLFLRLP